MGENICKWCNRQGINFQNTRMARAAQYHKNKQRNQKMGKDLNRQFPKEDTESAKKHMKRCLTSLITREKQIKTTMRYHLTPVRMTIIKKSTNRASLVVQWLRIHLPMQRTQVRALVWEDPTCHRATKPMGHNY